ncbi:MAG: nuclear transport factor 2 family protein [Planctomycetota bacterium]
MNPSYPPAAQLWQRWYQEMWIGEDEDAIDRMIAADAPLHFPGDARLTRPELKAWCRAFLERWDVIGAKVLDPIVQGDWVSVRTELTIRERSSGREVTVDGQQRAIVRDGMFREVWDCWSWADAMERLGSLPQETVAHFLVPPV